MAEAGEEKKEKKEKEKEDKKDKGKGKDEEGAKPAKGGLLKNKKMLIIIGAVVVLGGGGGAFVLTKGGPPPEGGEEAHVEEVADAHGAKKDDAHGGKKDDGGGGKKDAHGGKANVSGGSESSLTVGSNMKLPPFIVNLRDNSGRRYLKLSITLELASSSSAGDIDRQEAKIRDSIIVLLSSKSYAEIGTVEGKYQLRDEVVLRINQFLDEKPVKTVYFTEFVIQ